MREPVWDEAAIEAVAVDMFAKAMSWSDRSYASARKRWDKMTPAVQESWRKEARRLVTAYFAALDRDALSIAGRLEAMAGLLSLPHGPAVLEVVVDDLLCAASRLRALGLIPTEDKDRETGRRVREEVERRLGGRFSPQDRVAVESVAADIAAEARERGLIPTEGGEERG